jgi:putative CocE/NonD family hydrolase
VRNAGSRLTLGPWAHTGLLAIHGFSTGVPSQFDHGGELVSFFDAHLLDAPRARDDAPVHYFTTGEEAWKSSSTWPPPELELRTLHLAPGRLTTDAPSRAHVVVGTIDPDTGTGARSRWRSLLSLVPGDYPDRRARDSSLLTFDSPPLDRSLEVTGHPIVTLHVSWDGDHDAQLFVYLEDVSPDGDVWYVSEGQLSARHRAVTRTANFVGVGVPRSFLRADSSSLRSDEVVEMKLDMLPFSHRFGAGHRVRVAIAGADCDHFARARRGQMRIHTGPDSPCRIQLPTAHRAEFR